MARAKSYQNRLLAKNEPTRTPGERHATQLNQKTNSETVNCSYKHAFEKVAALNLKAREVLKETLTESFRKGGYLRIYPCQTSNHYDKYFPQTNSTIWGQASGPTNLSNIRVTNKMLYQMLYTEEVLPQ